MLEEIINVLKNLRKEIRKRYKVQRSGLSVRESAKLF